MPSHAARRAHSVGIRQLKAELSEQLRRVKAGETVSITERGRVIATIHPVVDGVVPPGVVRMRELAAQGKVIWAGGKPKGAPRPPRLRGGVTVADAVLEDRR